MYNYLPKTRFLGRKLIYLPTCHSTNDIASSLFVNPEVSEGKVLITDNQTAGKGQRGNSWEAEPGSNLTFSVILRPTFLKVNQQFSLNIAISLGVYDLLTIYLPEKIKIKWPNDIYFSSSGIHKKISGILIQNSLRKDLLESSVVGIGLNINQSEFNDPRAVSLSLITGKTYSLPEIFYSLMECLERRYLMLLNGDENQLRKDYLTRMYRYGSIHPFKSGSGVFNGEICGIDDLGRLLIRSGDRVSVFNFKEVEYLEN